MCVVFSIGYIQCDFVYAHYLISSAAAVNKLNCVYFVFCSKRHDQKIGFSATIPEVEVIRDFDPKIPASGEKLILRRIKDIAFK